MPCSKRAQRLSPGSFSAHTVLSPQAQARKRSPLSILKHFTSQRRQSSTLAQKRIGMPAMRKYKFARSANCSLCPLRRLVITTRRPPRTFSETELIFNESTNLAAASASTLGMSASPKFATGLLSGGGFLPSFPIGIVDFLFDIILLCDRMNRRVEKLKCRHEFPGSSLFDFVTALTI